MNKDELIHIHQLLELVVQNSKKDKFEGSFDVDLEDRDTYAKHIHKPKTDHKSGVLSLARKIGSEAEKMDFDKDEDGVTKEEVQRTSQKVVSMTDEQVEDASDKIFTQYDG